MDSCEKVYPTIKELNEIDTYQPCPDCPSVFKSKSNLNLHLAKTHRQANLLQSKAAQKLYFCPIETCPYNASSSFKQLKIIKQHFLKVHSEKRFGCQLCPKGFATEAMRRRHQEYCSVSFKCCDCSATYPNYETLKTHGRRKKHAVLEKSAYKARVKRTRSEETFPKQFKLILPKSSSDSRFFIADTSDRSCQTDFCQSSQETQTQLVSSSVETQTIGDCLRKNSKTQTMTDLADQQTVFDGSQSDLLKETLDSNFFNCNMETQTEFSFSDDLFKYCDDYSNMCTQTCDDLVGEIELNHIYTQTVDDVLKSVESQTIMSQDNRAATLNFCKESVETQTDTQFKQMLEQINA